MDTVIALRRVTRWNPKGLPGRISNQYINHSILLRRASWGCVDIDLNYCLLYFQIGDALGFYAFTSLPIYHKNSARKYFEKR